MKFTLASILALSAAVQAHTIFHELSVDGARKGAYVGVRAPNSNNPYLSVNDANFACGSGLRSPVSSAVVTIPAGSKVGTFWQHQPGSDGSNDADNPIAASHKGPIQVYIAKVDNAATANGATAKWTKVASEGLNTATGRWAVDDLISNAGWFNFVMPSCIAPGDYLMRAEITALHEASAVGATQFYMSCANIRITGSGTTSVANQGVSFPGAYSATDPGILISIYGNTGKPDNNLKPYTAPGPAVLTCAAGGNPAPAPTTTPKPTTSTKAPTPTTMVTATKPATTTPVTPPTTGGAPKYGQCGGMGWSGPTTCAEGKCTYGNDWYSQCL